MATAAASPAIFCELAPQRPATRRDQPAAASRLRPADPASDGGKIMLQPRLCTLRSYGSGERRRDDVVMLRPPANPSVAGPDASSPFFASLADYIDSSRKSQHFETVSGRLAMIAFAAAVGVEAVTGDSLFQKQELQRIAEAAGVGVAVVAFAAAFAWFSSARARIRQMLTLGCNTFVDSLIDNLVEGLFFDNDLSDWSDDP